MRTLMTRETIAGAVLLRARKLRCRRGREPSEEAAGQARAVVNHDASAKAGLIQGHAGF
jgi:hypothetical protein